MSFTQVLKYVPGKSDWMAAGLPTEGKLARVLVVGSLAEREVPTCHLADRLGELRERAQRQGSNACVVINEEQVVLGIIRGRAWDSHPDMSAEQVMEPGPTSLRPNVPAEEAQRYIEKHSLDSVVITTSEGKLIGLLKRKGSPAAGKA